MREINSSCIRDFLTIEAKVIPRSSKREISAEGKNKIKIKVNAPPAEGEANSACINAICSRFKLKKNQVEIFHGAKSRNKIIKIVNINKEKIKLINDFLEKS